MSLRIFYFPPGLAAARPTCPARPAEAAAPHLRLVIPPCLSWAPTIGRPTVFLEWKSKFRFLIWFLLKVFFVYPGNKDESKDIPHLHHVYPDNYLLSYTLRKLKWFCCILENGEYCLYFIYNKWFHDLPDIVQHCRIRSNRVVFNHYIRIGERYKVTLLCWRKILSLTWKLWDIRRKKITSTTLSLTPKKSGLQ